MFGVRDWRDGTVVCVLGGLAEDLGLISHLTWLTSFCNSFQGLFSDLPRGQECTWLRHPCRQNIHIYKINPKMILFDMLPIMNKYKHRHLDIKYASWRRVNTKASIIHVQLTVLRLILYLIANHVHFCVEIFLTSNTYMNSCNFSVSQ